MALLSPIVNHKPYCSLILNESLLLADEKYGNNSL